jgi:membrane-bound lytic murein transglycosylase A
MIAGLGKNRAATALFTLMLLAGCGRVIPEARGPVSSRPAPSRPLPVQPTQPAAPPPPANALVAGVHAGPSIASFGLTPASAGPVLAAFRASCPRLTSRNDPSGLTVKTDWQSACSAASDWPTADAPNFFNTYFRAVTVGSGASFVTGYYEPEIAGSRQHIPGYDAPVYGMPADLVHARPGDGPVKPNGQTPLAAMTRPAISCPITSAPRSRTASLPGRIWNWPGSPIRSSCSSCRCRARDGCASPTAR